LNILCRLPQDFLFSRFVTNGHKEIVFSTKHNEHRTNKSTKNNKESIVRVHKPNKNICGHHPKFMSLYSYKFPTYTRHYVME